MAEDRIVKFYAGVGPRSITPCLKKLCKFVFVRTLSKFHQF